MYPEIMIFRVKNGSVNTTPSDISLIINFQFLSFINMYAGYITINTINATLNLNETAINARILK